MTKCMQQQYYQTQNTKYNSMANNDKHDIEYITAHSDDFAYSAITFNIDIYQSKQSKTSIPSINQQNPASFSVTGAVVIDAHQRTQTEKRSFLSNTARKQPLKKDIKQRFCSLCSLMYINNHSTYDFENFTVAFIDT